jgi:hypothetical protein
MLRATVIVFCALHDWILALEHAGFIHSTLPPAVANRESSALLLRPRGWTSLGRLGHS